MGTAYASWPKLTNDHDTYGADDELQNDVL
jgi:hypothetical protein